MEARSRKLDFGSLLGDMEVVHFMNACTDAQLMADKLHNDGGLKNDSFQRSHCFSKKQERLAADFQVQVFAFSL